MNQSLLAVGTNIGDEANDLEGLGGADLFSVGNELRQGRIAQKLAGEIAPAIGLPGFVNRLHPVVREACHGFGLIQKSGPPNWVGRVLPGWNKKHRLPADIALAGAIDFHPVALAELFPDVVFPKRRSHQILGIRLGGGIFRKKRAETFAKRCGIQRVGE